MTKTCLTARCEHFPPSDKIKLWNNTQSLHVRINWFFNCNLFYKIKMGTKYLYLLTLYVVRVWTDRVGCPKDKTVELSCLAGPVNPGSPRMPPQAEAHPLSPWSSSEGDASWSLCFLQPVQQVEQ